MEKEIDKLESWTLGPYDTHISKLEDTLKSMKEHRSKLRSMFAERFPKQDKMKSCDIVVIDDDGEID